ncbi:MAG: NAD(P)-dependent oxidoreductase [Euryarchaeota archaeon]|nr:NAD(P)-dependent oxidoreductase [Euryarchaeota archaeon]
MNERPLFVAGAAGFLGSAVLSAARRRHFSVRALVRTGAQAAAIAAPEVEPVIGDLLAPETYATALRGCGAVLHLAQSSSEDLSDLRRVRVEGGRALFRAASAAGVERLVVGSGYWVYADKAGLLTEESPLRPLHLAQVNFDTEEAARAEARESGVGVVVARPGMVYGPGSWLRSWVQDLTEGSFRFVDKGANFMSPIHWADCGEALLLLATTTVRREVYLVVDDEPVTVRELSEFVARTLALPSPSGMPLAEAKAVWGDEVAELNAASRRASNAELRRLGWSPRFPTFRDGLPEVLRSLRVADSSPSSPR